MNADIVNRFIATSRLVLREYFNLPVESGGPPRVIGHGTSLEPVSVMVGVVGDLVGQFILGYEESVALGIARSMMSDPGYAMLDDLCISALSELGNIIGGVTATELAALGYHCDISPPTVVRGQHISISVPAEKILVLPLQCSAGSFSLYIALKQGKAGNGN